MNLSGDYSVSFPRPTIAALELTVGLIQGILPHLFKEQERKIKSDLEYNSTLDDNHDAKLSPDDQEYLEEVIKNIRMVRRGVRNKTISGLSESSVTNECQHDMCSFFECNSVEGHVIARSVKIQFTNSSLTLNLVLMQYIVDKYVPYDSDYDNDTVWQVFSMIFEDQKGVQVEIERI